jgi:hypothetical protein
MRITTDAIPGLQLAADDPRAVTGLAVPYAAISTKTKLGREGFAPGAFAASVKSWMDRQDGARAPFRPRHGERPVGVVTHLEDTPQGVMFRASIFDGAAGDQYLSEVQAGLNGVSVEAATPEVVRRGRDGNVLHKQAELSAIAGSDYPAFDSARIALHDSEGSTMTEATADTPQTTDGATAAAVAPVPPDVRADAERNDPTVQSIARSSILITRAPAIFGAHAERLPRGDRPGFFADAWAAKDGDADAADRQWRYRQMVKEYESEWESRSPNLNEYAGDVLSTEIPGAYPNDYLPSLLTPRILKGRPMGSFFNRFPISDGRPKIFAKVTTSTTVAVQSAEGANPAASDLATTAVTATPLIYGGETVVSRQALDGGDPSVDTMIMNDLIEAYAQASETVIKTAVEAGATASGTAITAATPFAGALGNIIKYYTTRFKPAEAQFVPSALFAVLLAEADTTGRPKMPLLNPMNSDGTTAPGGVSGSILGATDYLSYASTVNVVVTTRSTDYVIYESPVARFSFDAVTGPSAVRIGIWAYLVVGTRLGGLSVTAA